MDDAMKLRVNRWQTGVSKGDPTVETRFVGVDRELVKSNINYLLGVIDGLCAGMGESTPSGVITSLEVLRVELDGDEAPSPDEERTNMNLYEIRTGMIGESYERAYAWAKNLDEARKLFFKRHPIAKIDAVTLLVTSSSKPFCTALSDDGWLDPLR